MATYLGVDVFTLATANLLLQTIAYLILFAGVGLARKKDFKKHGKVMGIATLLNYISLAIVMLPSFLSTIPGISFEKIGLSPLITIVHALLGGVTLVMASLAVLSCGWVGKKFGNLKNYMIILFTLWSITYFLGIIIYLMLYSPF